MIFLEDDAYIKERVSKQLASSLPSNAPRTSTQFEKKTLTEKNPYNPPKPALNPALDWPEREYSIHQTFPKSEIQPPKEPPYYVKKPNHISIFDEDFRTDKERERFMSPYDAVEHVIDQHFDYEDDLEEQLIWKKKIENIYKEREEMNKVMVKRDRLRRFDRGGFKKGGKGLSRGEEERLRLQVQFLDDESSRDGGGGVGGRDGSGGGGGVKKGGRRAGVGKRVTFEEDLVGGVGGGIEAEREVKLSARTLNKIRSRPRPGPKRARWTRKGKTPKFSKKSKNVNKKRRNRRPGRAGSQKKITAPKSSVNGAWDSDTKTLGVFDPGIKKKEIFQYGGTPKNHKKHLQSERTLRTERDYHQIVSSENALQLINQVNNEGFREVAYAQEEKARRLERLLEEEQRKKEVKFEKSEI